VPSADGSASAASGQPSSKPEKAKEFREAHKTSSTTAQRRTLRELRERWIADKTLPNAQKRRKASTRVHNEERRREGPRSTSPRSN
jgi:hypothetical protein